MDVVIGSTRVKLNPSDAIGKGGEADVYRIGNDRVAKIFKDSKHPDFIGMPYEQAAADRRIMEHQTKLRSFPTGMPPRVISPIDLVTDKRGTIIGYTMPFINGGEVLLRFGEKKYRQNVSNDTVTAVFRDLHGTLTGVHGAGAIIGDFNDLNVLVVGNDAYLIDADSMQYGTYICHMFTSKFLDPLLAMPDMMVLDPTKKHNEHSDWYAYNVMLFQSLLFVGPYGGVYRPTNPANKIAPEKRPLARITVFNQEVTYPKPANRIDTIPDDLLHHFHQVFEKDNRGEFPRALLDNIQWIVCKDCGTTHSKYICPVCGQKGIGKVVQTIRVRGVVTATTMFKTNGIILHAVPSNDGHMQWLYHENGTFYREQGREVIKGIPENTMRFRISNKDTIICKDHKMVTIAETGSVIDQKSVDGLGWLPAMDANHHKRFWVEGGVLYRDGKLGYQVEIGKVLSNQTQIWVGSVFGFGYYRAGAYYGAFVFDADSGILNDGVKLPPIPGQIIDTTCVFSDTLCWFFVKHQHNGNTMNRVYVIDRTGNLLGQTEVVDGEDSWLGTIRGKCAVKNLLMSTTDSGIVRVEVVKGVPSVIKEFPDTEPFVSTGDHLYPCPDGIYVVSLNEITKLQIK